jgi:hypothetical protein
MNLESREASPGEVVTNNGEIFFGEKLREVCEGG